MDIFLDEYELGIVNIFTSRLKSATAARDYKREVNNFKKFIEKDILSATDQDGKNYLEFLKKEKKAATTILRIYKQLNAFYNYLFIDKLVEYNPFHKIDRPKASERVRPDRTPNPEQLKKLLDALYSNFELRDYTIVLLIATTGIKLSDVLSITLQDLIYDKEFMAIRLGQGENVRYIRVLEPVREVIMKYLFSLSIPTEYMDKPYYIFIGSRDIDKFILTPGEVKPITKDWIVKVMNEACRTANIPVFTSKDLRHAHALYALRLGASVDDVADQLGWNHTNLVYKYAGVMEQLLLSANSYTEVFFNQILEN